jgi:hypothetical protein
LSRESFYCSKITHVRTATGYSTSVVGWNGWLEDGNNTITFDGIPFNTNDPTTHLLNEKYRYPSATRLTLHRCSRGAGQSLMFRRQDIHVPLPEHQNKRFCRGCLIHTKGAEVVLPKPINKLQHQRGPSFSNCPVEKDVEIDHRMEPKDHINAGL